MSDKIKKNYTALSIILSSIIITSGFYLTLAEWSKTLTGCTQTLAESIKLGGLNARSHFSAPSSLDVKLSGALGEADPKKTIDDRNRFKSIFKNKFDELIRAENKDHFISSEVTLIKLFGSGRIMFDTEVKLKNQGQVRKSTTHLYQDGFGAFIGRVSIPMGNGQSKSKIIEIR